MSERSTNILNTVAKGLEVLPNMKGMGQAEWRRLKALEDRVRRAEGHPQESTYEYYTQKGGGTSCKFFKPKFEDPYGSDVAMTQERRIIAITCKRNNMYNIKNVVTWTSMIGNFNTDGDGER
ncbi:hypothetical protein ACLOJK_041908 [Asimina triloba]